MVTLQSRLLCPSRAVLPGQLPVGLPQRDVQPRGAQTDRHRQLQGGSGIMGHPQTSQVRPRPRRHNRRSSALLVTAVFRTLSPRLWKCILVSCCCQPFSNRQPVDITVASQAAAAAADVQQVELLSQGYSPLWWASLCVCVCACVHVHAG